jgi:hypothetical protein
MANEDDKYKPTDNDPNLEVPLKESNPPLKKK